MFEIGQNSRDHELSARSNHVPGPRGSGYSKSSTRLEDVSPHTESATRNTFQSSIQYPCPKPRLHQLASARTNFQGGAEPPGREDSAQGAAEEGRSESAEPRPERGAQRRDPPLPLVGAALGSRTPAPRTGPSPQLAHHRRHPHPPAASPSPPPTCLRMKLVEVVLPSDLFNLLLRVVVPRATWTRHTGPERSR